jgi:hypothetical protein
MKLLLAALCSLSLFAVPALAQDKKDAKKEAPKKEAAKKEPSEAQKKQMARMKDCNEQAGAKKMEGDARKGFMKSCLSGKPAVEAKKMSPQQEKMAMCNKQAAEKKVKGEDRQKFMSGCLKG